MSEESLFSFCKSLLDPMDRISEILCGLITVLAVTNSISVAGGEGAQVHRMLIGALGCNLAWGIIDGVFYLLGAISQRGHGLTTWRKLRVADAADVHRIISDALPPIVASVLSTVELDALRERLNRLPDPPIRVSLTKRDWRAALGIFLLVVLSTFPVTIPFMFVSEARIALDISNGIAILMLFLAGYGFGKYAGQPPWRTGLWMVLLGFALVGVSKALGG